MMYAVTKPFQLHTSSTFSTWDSNAASASFPAAVVEATEMSSFSERFVAVLEKFIDTSPSVSLCCVCFDSFFVFWRFCRLVDGAALDFVGFVGDFFLLGV